MIQSMIFALIVLLAAHSLFAGDDQAVRAGQRLSDLSDLIPLVTSDDILARIEEGANVIFIDAREIAEYQEDHLPGARNLTLRQVTETSAQRFGDADLIVTYCLKDFRGYELGRALQDRGIRNVRLMKDHGINGWRKQGLPVASRDGLTDVEALALLRRCADDKSTC